MLLLEFLSQLLFHDSDLKQAETSSFLSKLLLLRVFYHSHGREQHPEKTSILPAWVSDVNACWLTPMLTYKYTLQSFLTPAGLL